MRDPAAAARVPAARRDGDRPAARDDCGRRAAHGLLPGAETRFQLLVETMPGVAYVAAPTQDGQWFYISPRLRELLGYDPQEWIDDPVAWTRLLHPDDRDRVLADEVSWAREGQGLCVAEYRLRDAVGSYRWIRDAATAVPGDGDDAVVWFGVLTDVTDARVAQEAVRDSEQMLRSVLRTAKDAFIAIDPQGRVVEWNSRAEQDFGRSREEALGRHLPELVIPERYRAQHARGVAALAAADVQRDVSRAVEIHGLRADGSEFPLELVMWSSGAGPTRRYNAFLRDITDRRRMEDELQALAFQDALTGLPNRTVLRTRLGEALAAAGASGTAVALLFLDVDDFKAINDGLGHAAGDLVLVAVAERLVATCGPARCVARFAGDEFAVLLPQVADAAEAVAVADRIAAALRRPIAVEDRWHTLSASIGVAVVLPSAPADVAEVLRDADAAMYDAKRLGRDRVVLFDPAIRARALARLQMKADLDEALLRWHHPVHGRVPPLDFVPLAEETGRIVQIGAWVLEEACRQAVTWGPSSAVGPSVSVNVSAVQLQDDVFPAFVAKALAHSGLDARRLVLEVTESVLLSGVDAVAERLRAIRSTGVRIAVDDFGTGYSSLSYLQHLPLDQLKIDRAFLADCDGEDDAVMARVVVHIARALALTVVAEGVERPAQLEVLRGLDCDLVQGWLTGRPMPADAARDLARTSHP